MQCPRCKSASKVKNGIVRGQQRYKCKNCGCNYTLGLDVSWEKERKRRLALSLYLEGLSFHAIGRLLGVSHVSVLNWIRKYRSEPEEICNMSPVKVIKSEEAQVLE